MGTTSIKKMLPLEQVLVEVQDAATTLLVLNKLVALNTDHLAILGGSLGADIPVFIYACTW